MPKYTTFHDFYPFYLSEHSNRTSRRLHFIGSLGVLALIVMAIVTGSNGWFVLVPICGYGFAWTGHFFFEKNRPATFTYPFYSLAGDWVMFKDILIGRIKF